MDMISQTVILQALVYGLLNGSIYALVSVGFTMIFGVMDLVYFAYGGLTAASMYISLLLYENYGIDPYTSMIFTIPLFFIIGIIIYKSVIRWMLKTPHHTQMMATLGMMIFFENLLLFIFKATPRSVITSYTTSMLPLWGEIRLSVPRFKAMIVAIIVIVSLFLFLKKTIFGKEIRAIADEEEGAMLVGIETDKLFMVAFAIACVLEAIAGSSVVAFYTVDPFTGFGIMIKAFMVVVLVGLGNIPAAIVGGLFVGVMEALSAVFISASLGTGFLFLILAVVLIFKPSGVFGTITE